MRKRYIEIPEKRPLKNVHGQQFRTEEGAWAVTDHQRFVFERSTDGRFAARGFAGFLQAADIRRAFDEGANGIWVLDGDDHKELVAAIEEPHPRTIPDPLTGHNYLPDMKAICDAGTEDPHKVADPPSDEDKVAKVA